MIIKEKTNETITTSTEAYKVFKAVLDMRGEEDAHKECFYTMGLNSQNSVLFVDLNAIGTINYCGSVVREAVRQAIVKHAASIIVCHNHPSGNTDPSKEDNIFTDNLAKACKVLGIALLDHIIVGTGNFDSLYYSYEGKDLIPKII